MIYLWKRTRNVKVYMIQKSLYEVDILFLIAMDSMKSFFGVVVVLFHDLFLKTANLLYNLRNRLKKPLISS